MSTLNRAAYEQLISEDLDWLLKQPRSLERDHIEAIVRRSPENEYGSTAAPRSRSKKQRSKTIYVYQTYPHKVLVEPILNTDILIRCHVGNMWREGLRTHDLAEGFS